MKLEIINNLLNDAKANEFVKNFIKELSNYLMKETGEKENLRMQEKNSNINELREENQLYQVVDRSLNGVYLQNMNSKQVFEETEITKELMEKIGNDYILRYKNGKYIFEEELTDDFLNGLS